MSDINWHDRVKSTTFSVRNLINGEFSEPQGPKISKFAPNDGTLLYEFGEAQRLKSISPLPRLASHLMMAAGAISRLANARRFCISSQTCFKNTAKSWACMSA